MDYKKYMDAKSAEIWEVIVDIIGPENHWPARFVHLFFKDHLINKDRFQMMLFAYVNGLNPLIILDWCDHRRILRDVAARRHMVYVANQLEKELYNRYYSYNVSCARYEYADGRIYMGQNKLH